MSKKNKLTIGFAGTPELAYRHFLKISESSDIDIRFVLTQPDKKTGRGQKPSNSLLIVVHRRWKYFSLII